MRTTGNMSAISAQTTDPAQQGLPRAFATLRFAGDRLVPGRLTHMLGIEPTLACRKGEDYKRDRAGRVAHGRTGVWYLSTGAIVRGSDLAEHLRYLMNLIRPADDPGRKGRVERLMLQDGLEADVSCFWHGSAGAIYPTVPDFAVEFFAQLPARLETDFDTD